MINITNVLQKIRDTFKPAEVIEVKKEAVKSEPVANPMSSLIDDIKEILAKDKK